jgi:putative transposase
MPASFSYGARKTRTRRQSCFSSTATQTSNGYGKLQMELEWLKKNLSCSDALELCRLVDGKHPELRISRQCELLGLPRSSLYFRPVPVREATLRIMARLDSLYLEDPCSGSRRMVHYLANEGIPIGRDRGRHLMRRMGLGAIYQKPRTTIPGQPSERFPCLFALKQITEVDQIWATDFTYIPLLKGFLYLVAIMDLHSRHVLSWKLTGSLDTEFCLEALEMALSAGRKPQIFDSDQGCQYTSAEFVARLKAEEIKISWSGRKRCYDNILVERLWRTLKYEEVDLRAYPMATAGRLKSAWPTSSGGIAMVGPIAPWQAELPNWSILSSNTVPPVQS